MIYYGSWDELEMLEKLLLATSLTLSLNLFLGLSADYAKPASLGDNQQVTLTQTVSQLLAKK